MADGTRRVDLGPEELDDTGTRRVPLNAAAVVSDAPASAEPVRESTRRVDMARKPQEASPERTAPRGPIILAWQAPGAKLFEQYSVIETLQMHETSRPGVYHCDSPAGEVVVKVHALQPPPDAALWRKLTALSHPTLIRIFEATERDGFFYEVQEYCAGGSLAEHVPPAPPADLAPGEHWIRQRLLPTIIPALCYLHKQDVVHRDVKPSNIFLRETRESGDIVLGDYDISTVVEGGQTSRHSTRFMATHVYAAPELYPQIGGDGKLRTRVSFKSDWWALGITLIELLVGTTTAHQEGEGGLQQFFMTGRRIGIPGNLSEELTLLLQGLLIRDDHLRWGDEQVERWLAGQTTAADRKLIERDMEEGGGSRSQRPYKLGELEATSLRELSAAMAREPDLAAEDLLSGDLLINWVGQLDTNIARAIGKDRERYRHDDDLALQAAILRLNPRQAFEFGGGRSAETPEQWGKIATEQLAGGPQRHVFLGSTDVLDRLTLWLELKEPSERELADAVRRINKFEKAQARIEGVLWLLDPARPFTFGDGLSATTPQQIAALAYGAPSDWKRDPPGSYEALLKAMDDERLLVWLEARGLRDIVEELNKLGREARDYPALRIEKALRMLDPQLPRVQVKLDASEVRRRVGVPYGGSRIYALPWKVEGPGVPHAAIIRSDENAPFVQPQLIAEREGLLELRLDAYDGLQPVGKYESRIGFSGGFTNVDPGEIEIKYSIAFPHYRALLRIGLGALIGMLLLGVLRAALNYLVGNAPIELAHLDAAVIWEDVRSASYTTIGFLFALLLVLAGLYGGYRLALYALSSSEA